MVTRSGRTAENLPGKRLTRFHRQPPAALVPEPRSGAKVNHHTVGVLRKDNKFADNGARSGLNEPVPQEFHKKSTVATDTDHGRPKKASAMLSNSSLRSICAQWPQSGKVCSSAREMRRIGRMARSSGLT